MPPFHQVYVEILMRTVYIFFLLKRKSLSQEKVSGKDNKARLSVVHQVITLPTLHLNIFVRL